MSRSMLMLSAFFVPFAAAACSSGGGNTGGAGGGVGGGTTSTTATTTTTTTTSATTTSTTTGGMGAFSCIGSVMWGKPTMPMVTVPYTFSDAQTMMTKVSGAMVKACAVADAACAAPVGMGTTDAMGAVSLTLPTGTVGFDGFLDIKAANYVPALFYPSRPIIDNSPATGVLISNATFMLIPIVLGTMPDPTRGHITVAGLDCMGMPAAGVSFTVDTADAKSVTAYIVGTGMPLPDKNAKETDANGAALIANVPAGMATLTATVAATKVKIATYKFVIRAGTITVGAVEPTP